MQKINKLRFPNNIDWLQLYAFSTVPHRPDNRISASTSFSYIGRWGCRYLVVLAINMSPILYIFISGLLFHYCRCLSWGNNIPTLSSTYHHATDLLQVGLLTFLTSLPMFWLYVLRI